MRKTVTVTAYGAPKSGVWPKLDLLVDGRIVQSTFVNTTGPKRYSFDIDLPDGQSPVLGIGYANDTTGRNLYVTQVELDGRIMRPTDPGVRFDRGALDGHDMMAGRGDMIWNGTLLFPLPKQVSAIPTRAVPSASAPISDQTTCDSEDTVLTITARGKTGDGVPPEFTVLVNGKPIGLVKTGKTFSDHSFKLTLPEEHIKTVQLQYGNDARGRDLFVQKITVNNQEILPTDSRASFDRDALDGKNVIRGTGDIWWNGTLTLDMTKNTDSNATPAPTPSQPAPVPPTVTKLSVTASGRTPDSTWPEATVLVNGTAVGKVVAGAANRTVTFDVPLAAGQIKEVALSYENDRVGRDLFVEKLVVGGVEIRPTDDAVRYDRGMLDGHDVIAGRVDMLWNGTLLFDVDDRLDSAPPAQPAPLPAPAPVVVTPAPAPAPSPEGLDARFGAPLPDALPDGALSATGQVIRIARGTGSEQIERIINSAPKGATIEFGEGTYVMTSNIAVNRGDITIKGQGIGKTTLDWRYPKGTGDDAISFTGGQKTKVATLAAGTDEDSRVITVTDASKIKAGDTLFISQANDTAYFRSIGAKDADIAGWMARTDYQARKVVVEVSKVVGNKVYLDSPVGFDFAAGKATVAEMRMLENVRVGDFSITYSSLGSAAGVKWGTNQHPEFHMHSYAMEMNGLKNAVVKNISIRDAASGGYTWQDSLYVQADNLSVQGAHNKGGGYGYAFNLDTLYNSHLTGLSDRDMRHGVTFHSWGTSGNNHVQVDFTNRDVNFHAGPDWNNWIDVRLSDTHTGTTQYNQAVYYNTGGARWGAPTSMADNVVTFQKVVGGHGLEQYLVASPTGGILIGNSAADTLVARNGNDILTGQGGADRFVIRADGSRDRITDFNRSTDKLWLDDFDMGKLGALVADIRRVDLDGNGTLESTRIDFADFGGGSVDLVGVTGITAAHFAKATGWAGSIDFGL